MQKREQSKVSGGGVSGGAASPASKRGRPSTNTADSNSSDPIAPNSLLGPTLQIPSSFADQNHKRIVLALQSGLKSEITWALNILSLLSFREKDEIRRDATPLAKIPNLLDSVLQIIDDWRDASRLRTAQIASQSKYFGVSRFENEFKAMGWSKFGSELSKKESLKECWFEEVGFLNLDEEGLMEKQQCAVAASNIVRNFAFMPDNEVIMAQHRHCLETVFQCIEDYNAEDEELVTNALETVVNLAPLLNLQIFSSAKPSYIKITEKHAVQTIMAMLGSSVKAWHCAAAELLGRLIINPDNELFLLPFAPQIYKRLVDLLSLPAVDAQAAAVGALYNLAEVTIDCRLKLADERWAVDRLLKVIKTPHPIPEVCRKAAMILESLVSEPQNKALLLVYENTFAEMLFLEGRHADTFARILYELTSKTNNKVATTRAVWGI
ncbi:Armadillo repeat-containing protein lfr [Thalictrum thalictroides]|uniref:Armadillo repeat-containing protein lfr n=1 Tax=Thalictrum thalictroides TaxID=46969 RepID=A0A7J6VM78_THATH|nr:Armadillo repeat-containing protein lfr [Thalictrum thalictroides]